MPYTIVISLTLCCFAWGLPVVSSAEPRLQLNQDEVVMFAGGANWKLLYGDDANRPFTKASEGHVPLREEWKRLLPIIEKAERRVHTIASGGQDPGPSLPEPETLHGDHRAHVEQELSAFTVADGLQVNLFASEAQGLTSPLAIRWDPSGRMYVTVTTTYPHVFPGDVPNDKIIVLEDVDGDGKADRSTVFAEGLNIPTGMELGDGGVYVGQNTELLFLKDTDGDGKADLRRVLLGGFGNGDSHQTINSFVWSPGGELYMGRGDGIESRVETPWGSADLFQAGFYRLRPRLLQLHPLLDDFMGPGNPWGVAFDDWGQILSIDGAGGVTDLSLGQIPAKRRLRLGLIGDPGGYCGISHLDGRHLPKSFHGQFAVGDFHSNRVKCFSIAQAGAGLQLSWEQPLLQSKHRNFRPVDVRMGPDGAIYVVDWYNPITCHQDDKYRDPTRDKAHGRIWRVSSSLPTIKPPNLAAAPTAEVVAALAAPERWTRYQAKRELTRRDTSEVATQLSHWVETLDPKDPQYEHYLYEAPGTFATIEVVKPVLLAKLLNAKDYRARAFASRVTGRWHDRLENPLDLLVPRVEDEHARVRMEAVSSAAAIPSPHAITVVARCIDRPMDEAMNYVFSQAVVHLKPYWASAIERGELEFARPAHVAEVLSVGGDTDFIARLRELADADDQDPKSRAGAIATLVSVGSPEDVSQYGLDTGWFLRSGKYGPSLRADVLAKLIQAVQDRGLEPPSSPDKTLNRLIDIRATQMKTHWQLISSVMRVWILLWSANPAAEPPLAKTSPTASGFVSIFDGKTLDGWEATPKETASAWVVRDGMIVGDGDKGRGYLVYSKNKQITDLELTFRYQFPGKGNSGVSIRAIPDPTGKRDFQSYHADLGHVGIGKQILGAWDFHTPGRTEHRCFLGDRLVIDKNDKPKITAIKNGLTESDVKKGAWNDARVVAQSNQFQFYINGRLASEFTEHLDAKKRLNRGMIQLQLHDPGMIVHFKDLRLKVLDSAKRR